MTAPASVLPKLSNNLGLSPVETYALTEAKRKFCAPGGWFLAASLRLAGLRLFISGLDWIATRASIGGALAPSLSVRRGGCSFGEMRLGQDWRRGAAVQVTSD